MIGDDDVVVADDDNVDDDNSIDGDDDHIAGEDDNNVGDDGGNAPDDDGDHFFDDVTAPGDDAYKVVDNYADDGVVHNNENDHKSTIFFNNKLDQRSMEEKTNQNNINKNGKV